ncbi:MAG TPA: hypothetical protein VFC53_04730 [Dehalococcoidia bacterium]|nr:hypothetical protein [Dehalococcoidia bacterium]
MRATWPLIAVASLFALALPPGRVRAAGGLNRPEDPVVITGASVPLLQGAAPSAVVAFAWNAGWQQVPVQVDERFTQNFSAIYDNTPPPFSSTNINVLVYADPNTFTGADPDPTLDADDEIAFMAKDAGDLAPGGAQPAHTVPGSGERLTITDPLPPGGTGYVYLFRQDGTLDPGAGQSYVSYAFNLLSGNYKTTYHLAGGPNAENSTVTTPFYSHHFSDRWVDDELRVTAGASTGVDILDRHKALFAPGNCVRSEDTFDNGDGSFPGEGAFIVNKVGPVRAIRAYIGANSGPNTERDHIFYAQRQDIRTYLRVHAIPSVMDFFDYSPAATGMTYANDRNPAGVTIDGVPDSPAAGALQWELVTGAQGSLVMAGQAITNIAGFAYTSYYEDNATNPTTQCTGDADAYGSSGLWVNTSVPCTDPGLSCTSNLQAVRTVYYEPPGETASGAAALASRATTPLSVGVSPFAVASVGGIAVAATPAAAGGSATAWWALVMGVCAVAVAGALRARSRGRG